MSHHDHSDSKFFNGLFLGALLGAGLVVFLRTKEGQRLAKQLLESSEEVLDEVAAKAIEFTEPDKVK